MSSVFAVWALVVLWASFARPLDIIILHTNDMHARFEQTDALSGTCSVADDERDNCYGGFARLGYKVREFRNGSIPVLFLNGGDTYTGTPYFNLFRDRVVSEFLNLLKPDAASLGNHEFDKNVDGLVPFLNASVFPIVAANLDLSQVPQLDAMTSLQKSTVIRVKQLMVGIIGYLTPTTKQVSPPNDVRILDEIPSINAEASRLKATGVHLIIALGHSGIIIDQKIARECPDVDMVIGGHDNTFLWNGPQPDLEVPQGPYPLVVEKPDGKRVPVVQAYAFTKYLGMLKITVNDSGSITGFAGQPILLDNSVPRDPEFLALLNRYKPSVDAYRNDVVGFSRVFPNGTCKFGECNLGNLITDALVHAHVKRYNGPSWSDAAICFQNSGGIRTSGPTGNLTMLDLMTIIPFENQMLSVSMSGREIRQVLEHGVHRYSYTTRRGEFLQMSGIRVVYNLTQPTLERVHSVDVLCTECEVPEYVPLDETKNYFVIIIEFLGYGGNGFNMFEGLEGRFENITDIEAVKEYLQDHEIVYPAVEDRIQFIGHLVESKRYEDDGYRYPI